jgi:hypothetical protein
MPAVSVQVLVDTAVNDKAVFEMLAVRVVACALPEKEFGTGRVILTYST